MSLTELQGELDKLEHRSLEIGCLPIIEHIMERVDLPGFFQAKVPDKKLGRNLSLPNSKALIMMVANLMISRHPLYAVAEWAAKYSVEHLGFEPNVVKRLNDDRIGRALDRVHACDPTSSMTAFVIRVIRKFRIETNQFHADTTTVTVFGEYKEQNNGHPAITHGHNKDHRPDLKQLVFLLTVSADGAIPIHHKIYDGNMTDDKVHIRTWETLREIAGKSDFTYVGDSKLCSRPNMGYIHGQGGIFVTVLPRKRKEHKEFKSHVQDQPVAWREIVRKENPRNKELEDHVYKAYEPAERTEEGYRIIWYHSSVKAMRDAHRRRERIKKAKKKIRKLANRTGAHRFRSMESAVKAANEALRKAKAQDWLRVNVSEIVEESYKQESPGRPGKDTKYRRIEGVKFDFDVEEIGGAILADAKCDGLFAMVTNSEKFSPLELHKIYKYQPFLEKRNEQLKCVTEVAPVFLKRPERVAALLFLNYIALMLLSLIEREVRKCMEREGIRSLPIYPEKRKCKEPTAEVILRAFEGIRRHELVDGKGRVVKTFFDPVPPVAQQLLKMLGVPLARYQG